MITWEWLKHKKLVDISLKKRWEKDIMVLYGKELDICYLNKIGGEIISLSNCKNTASDIADMLLQTYDVDENELREDILCLIRELKWKRLVRLEE